MSVMYYTINQIRFVKIDISQRVSSENLMFDANRFNNLNSTANTTANQCNPRYGRNGWRTIFISLLQCVTKKSCSYEKRKFVLVRKFVAPEVSTRTYEKSHTGIFKLF